MDALRLLMTGTCPHCRAMFPVNRLAPAAFCSACGHEFPIPEATWSGLLREAVVRAAGLAVGDTGTVARRELALTYKRTVFGCLTCGKIAGSIHGFGKHEDRCDGCGTPLALRPLGSTPYASFLGELSHVYGEQPERGEPGAAAPGEVSQFPCASCGASLPLDGNTQSVICTFCHQPSHVPLRFLYRGHRDVPEPWGALFASPLPARSTDLGAVFDWVCVETELPFVASLGHGRVLVSATYQETRLDERKQDIEHAQCRALLVLTPREGTLEPALLWQRRDLSLVTGTEKRPFLLVPGAERLLVRTHSSILVLDSQTGDTVRVLPVDGPEAASFERPAVALPEGRVHEARDRTTSVVAVGDAISWLAAGYREGEKIRPWVTLTRTDGEVRARGELTLPPDDDRDQQKMHVSMGALEESGPPLVWLQLDKVVYRGEISDGKVKLAPVREVRLAGKAVRPFVGVAFGRGVAAIADRGAFRVFDREGKLAFDAASLPRPPKKSHTALVKELTDNLAARAMEQHARVQAEADIANANYERAQRAKGMKILLLTLAALVVVGGLIAAIAFLAAR